MVRNKLFPVKSMLLGSAAIAILHGAGVAFAQDGEDTSTVLSTIVVEADARAAQNGIVDGYVPKVISGGAKTATPVTEIPQSVSTVGRQQIDDLGATKMDEALAYTSGVNTALFGQDVRYNWFSVRGVRADAQGNFLDGMPLFQYAFGGYYLDPYFIDRFEVIKGPASALYGGAPIGGIVNQISKRPTGERLREVETGINSWGNAFFGFDIGDAIAEDGSISYRITGKTSGGGWETDHADDFRWAIAPSITWAPDDATSLTVLSSYTKVDGKHTGGFFPYVGTVVDAPAYGKIPKDFFYGDIDLDYFKSDQAMLGYEFEHTFDNGLTFRQNVRYSYIDSGEAGPYTWDQDLTDTQLDRLGFGVSSIVNQFVIDNRLEAGFDTAGLSHKLMLGLDYKHYNMKQLQWSYAATPIDVLNPVYTGGRLGPDQSYLNEDFTAQQAGIYLQDQIKFGDGWIATLNGRYDFLKTDVWNGPTYWSTTTSTQQADHSRFSGRAGLAYQFDNGLTPYVSYSSAFDPAFGTDGVTGEMFKPVTGTQFEAGFKYEPSFFDGLITASYFDMKRQNVAVPLATNPFARTQVGEVGYKGFELEAQANLDGGWKLAGALTIMDVKVLEDDDAALIGSIPTLTPERTASLWLDYSFQGQLEGWSAGAGIRYTGKSYADAANAFKVPGYTLFDAAVRYDAETWGGSLNVANIFDKDYVAGCSDVLVCNFGEGRRFLLKVNAKF